MSADTWPKNLPAGAAYLQPGYTVEFTREGLARMKCTFISQFNNIVTGQLYMANSPSTSLARTRGAVSPLFPSLLLYDAVATGLAGTAGMGKLECEYRGLDPALGAPPPPVYSLERSTGNEPLLTHPLWSTKIAGTPAKPLNGAQFVSVDTTTGFSYCNPGPQFVGPGSGPDPKFNPATAVFNQWLATSIFAGIEDYLVPGSVFLETYVAFSPPNLDGAGNFSDPDGPAPAAPNNFAWFFMGGTYTDEEGIYRCQKSWKLQPTGDAVAIIYGEG